MKNYILVATVFLISQVTFAVGFTAEKIEARIKPYAERVEKAKLEKGGDFTKDAKVMKLITDSLDKIVSDAGVGQTSYLIKLINNDSGRAVLTEVARLSSIIGDKSASASEVATSKKALELLSLSGKSLELLSKNATEAKAQQVKVDLALKVSEKIATFATYKSERAKKYVEIYERSLENGMSPHDAMAEANIKSKEAVADKKDITEDDILACEKA